MTIYPDPAVADSSYCPGVMHPSSPGWANRDAELTGGLRSGLYSFTLDSVPTSDLITATLHVNAFQRSTQVWFANLSVDQVASQGISLDTATSTKVPHLSIGGEEYLTAFGEVDLDVRSLVELGLEENDVDVPRRF